ncbi:hypothetical protein C900_01475 [Fulvivirga imtechensis AK7]|uniref:histidine kinase n=1 Tax=Fulvivirga imtechensis AK7 TaxID=1237149 RepID=L8JUL7_9BACT|nr:hypothetical protein C900_01475 [Fulvivirga imtechensis AK7]
MRAIVGTLALLFLVVIGGNGQNVSRGTIDLRNYNFQYEGPASLTGDWEFYYGSLSAPDDFLNSDSTFFLGVPGSWHRQGAFPVLGFATYRCRILLPHERKGLLIYIPTVNSAARVWVNGEVNAETGVIGTDEASYKAALRTIYANIPDQVGEVELVIQVANYSYFSAGMVSTPLLGMSTDLIEMKARMNGIENFFAGSLIAMFVYQLILYFLYNRGKPNLWLALICLGVALRSMILHGGSFLLPNMFPEVAFETWEKIEFGSVYLITAVFPLYIYHLFEPSSKKVVNAFVFVGVFLAIPVLFTPQHIYGQLLEICHLALILTFVYAIYTVTKAWRAGNSDARIIFFGVVASFPFILLEILQNSALLDLNFNFEYMVELGVLVFLLFQVYILARHYANSYRSLEVINKELETVITQRTSELVDSNTVKDRLLSIISHDVKSPLNSLQSLISLYHDKHLSRDEFDTYLKNVESDLTTTSGLVENVLYWTASQRKGEGVSLEQINLKILVEENIRHLQAIARNKSISIFNDVKEDIQLTTDRGILNFTLRNLIANAIKFSYQEGRIEIRANRVSTSCIIYVIDHGTGMTQVQMEHLLDVERVQSAAGTKSEIGTGLGLSLCREFLEKLGGKLTVESQKGEGSTFKVILPVT